MTAASDVALKFTSTENGMNGTPGTPGLLPGGGGANVPSSVPAVATETFAPPKERADIKSPQLPFGENVAVATGPLTAQ